MKNINFRIRAQWLLCFTILTYIILPILTKAQSINNTQSIIIGFYNFENYYDIQMDITDIKGYLNSLEL